MALVLVRQKVENWKETRNFMSSEKSEDDLGYIKKSSTLSKKRIPPKNSEPVKRRWKMGTSINTHFFFSFLLSIDHNHRNVISFAIIILSTKVSILENQGLCLN